MAETARVLAMQTLYQIEYEGAYANLAVKHCLAQNPGLSSVDRAFFTGLVYGVVRYRLTLDYLITRYSRIKLKKISKYILMILRLGIYQLLYLDKIPDSAAVNESVRMAKRYGHSASAGYVNGLLRAVLREREKLVFPEETIARLSVQYSYPEWLVERWISQFGKDFCEALLDAGNREPELCLRVNTLKTDRESLMKKIESARASGLCADAILCDGFDLAHSDVFREGLVTAQDIGAMLASCVLKPEPGEVVYDMCAAPGGKTTHIAQLMQNRGSIRAFDIHAHKIELIRQNASRLGIDMITAEEKDASLYDAALSQTADKILADVPCSGLGIIRRKPDIKWNKTQADDLSAIQMQILENAADYLKPGGELVYSTCTVEPAENELLIEAFLKKHPEFSAVDFTEILPEKLQKETAASGYLTLYPNVDETDGFFIAKLRKGVGV
ncbi:MAG: 16S rRNA (cytosine(967)-C(5))-methyltransferase RsmB [Ruminococcaceae bacterium]|nr:16S rRNA (cytosine(967)-C(5))-methyltransferase RsmB [Oscillospiraceae bacterium]